MTEKEKKEIENLRQAGQSYGQIAYALGVSVNTVKSYCRRIDKEESKCQYCKAQLIQTRQSKKFCNEKCRRSWWKDNDDKLSKKAYYSIICLECGKQFDSYGNKNRKFCSHACYIKKRFKRGCGEHVQHSI